MTKTDDTIDLGSLERVVEAARADLHSGGNAWPYSFRHYIALNRLEDARQALDEAKAQLRRSP